MSEGLTLDDLTVPLRALRLLAADFGQLPAPVLAVSPIYPDRVRLSFHDGPHEFEAWREALGIAPETVAYDVLDGGRLSSLQAFVTYAGATLELLGYAAVPAAEAIEGAA
ncbi:hypothetical protein ABZ845_04155 [Streptomyces sp. NPDC047022]|uniref:hypothetical protein n=1 Tax=Streptomyces sp. NPDC047022 TaxID=3155737 RepID=UPI0033F60491